MTLRLRDRIIWRIKAYMPRTARYAIRRAAYTILRPFYRGSTVECPVCDATWGRFVGDFAGGICPGCCTGSRHRLIALLLKQRGLTRGRILHFAPEIGLTRLFANLDVDYWPCDIDPPAGMHRCDITDIRLPGEFGGIIASHVLEHIPDDRRAMTELHRVLRPDGWALIVVPVADQDETFEDWSITSGVGRERAFGQNDHVRLYGRDITGRLQSAGFTVEEVAGGDMPDPGRYGLLARELAHLCRKPGV